MRVEAVHCLAVHRLAVDCEPPPQVQIAKGHCCCRQGEEARGSGSLTQADEGLLAVGGGSSVSIREARRADDSGAVLSG